MNIPQLMVGELVRRYGSINAASREAKIPLSTLFRLHSGEHADATFTTLRKIANGLDEPLYQVIRRHMDGPNGDGSH